MKLTENQITALLFVLNRGGEAREALLHVRTSESLIKKGLLSVFHVTESHDRPAGEYVRITEAGRAELTKRGLTAKDEAEREAQIFAAEAPAAPEPTPPAAPAAPDLVGFLNSPIAPKAEPASAGSSVMGLPASALPTPAELRADFERRQADPFPSPALAYSDRSVYEARVHHATEAGKALASVRRNGEAFRGQERRLEELYVAWVRLLTPAEAERVRAEAFGEPTPPTPPAGRSPVAPESAASAPSAAAEAPAPTSAAPAGSRGSLAAEARQIATERAAAGDPKLLNLIEAQDEADRQRAAAEMGADFERRIASASLAELVDYLGAILAGLPLPAELRRLVDAVAARKVAILDEVSRQLRELTTPPLPGDGDVVAEARAALVGEAKARGAVAIFFEEEPAAGEPAPGEPAPCPQLSLCYKEAPTAFRHIIGEAEPRPRSEAPDEP